MFLSCFVWAHGLWSCDCVHTSQAMCSWCLIFLVWAHGWSWLFLCAMYSAVYFQTPTLLVIWVFVNLHHLSSLVTCFVCFPYSFSLCLQSCGRSSSNVVHVYWLPVVFCLCFLPFLVRILPCSAGHVFSHGVVLIWCTPFLLLTVKPPLLQPPSAEGGGETNPPHAEAPPEVAIDAVALPRDCCRHCSLSLR